MFGLHSGPRTSRMSTKNLFENHEFLFVGEFCEYTISLATIMELASMAGASIKKEASQFSLNDPSKLKVILFDDTKTKLPAAKTARIKKESNIVCVNKSWMLDSLACYKLLNYSTYYSN